VALSLVEEADRAGVELDATAIDAVIAALGKVWNQIQDETQQKKKYWDDPHAERKQFLAS